jgi:CO/xanthine dehydrogenase Mo-binding subunit
MSQPPTPSSEPRGFVIERGNDLVKLPGSLHVNRQISRWLDFSTPGKVKVMTGKVELGQGVLTALAVIAADELGLNLDQIQMVSATTAFGPDEGMTSGSLSIQDSGSAIRQACAEIRKLTGLDGGDYWRALQGVSLDFEPVELAKTRNPEQRRLTGRIKPTRLDLPAKILGQPRFIHDLKPQGMLHARVLRLPSPKAELISTSQELQAVLDPKVRCVVLGNFVGVIAEQEWMAQQALDKLSTVARWSEPASLPDQHRLEDFLRNARNETLATAQKGEAGPIGTDTTLSSTYFKPYLAHASIGLCCALAHFDGRQLEVWTHSQGIHNLRDDMVRALSAGPHPLKKEQITIHHAEGAGCYGHNGADDVAFDAALLALEQPGSVIRVLWTREQELANAPLASAHLVDLKARLSNDGRIDRWSHELWSNGYSSRPGRAATSVLLAAPHLPYGQPAPIAINPPLAAGGGGDRNAVPGYAFENFNITNHRLLDMPLRTSAMRALGGYANVFAIESFMDELAHLSQQDPLQFRLRHLTDPRAIDVLKTVVARSTWWNQTREEGVGHGLAWARYKNSGAWCAVAARVQAGETLRVLNLDVAVDVGQVIDLDGVINQTEGGALQSMSWTLKESVAFDHTRVLTRSWGDYPVLRFSEVPQVTVHVIDRPEQPALGAGESAQGPVAAALGNALFNALGVRVRQLPLNQDHILQALHTQ